jgi:hypothetical protein
LSRPINPYDLAGRFTEEFVTQVLTAFGSDGFNVLLFGLGMLPDPPRAGIVRSVARAAENDFHHVYVYSCTPPDPKDVELLSEQRVVVTQDLPTLLRALRRLLGWRPPQPEAEAGVPCHAVTTPSAADEVSVKAWLAALGLPSPPGVLLAPDTSFQALRRPLALKGISERVAQDRVRFGGARALFRF